MWGVPVVVVLAAWTILYVAGRSLFLLVQLALFFPMFLLFGLIHKVQRLRKVFVCPVRKCSDTSLPAHVCRACGEPHDDLYPNLYGLFWHRCAKCGRALPTLNILGRRKLARRCRHCRLPRSHRTLPTRLVQIAGGTSSGKSCYLVMAIHQILDGEGREFDLCAAIDDPEQQKAFLRQWGELAFGRTIAKTIEVPKAWLLYVRPYGGNPFQLYLYDGPGEEYESVEALDTQQYFSELHGIVLLVDPKSFAAVSGPEARHALPFDEVVSTIVGRAILEMRPAVDNRFDLRVAVTISKADLPEVRRKIGDIRTGCAQAHRCRQAIADWGGGNALRVIEQRFKSVEFFACSPLGRDAGELHAESFAGVGLLEPLHWALTGARRRSAAQVSGKSGGA